MKPLKKIKEYEIIRVLYTRVGYGCYLVSGPDDKKYVLKAFELEMIEDASAELKAARILSGINHPHLVRIIKVAKDAPAGLYYYVMECWGDDLRNTIKVKPDPRVVLGIMTQVLEGLAKLHHHKLVHRDIKQENIFIKGNQVKLGDYGLVKSQRYVTELTTIAGTREYMAPEVRAGKPYDKRCDIYSAGIVLLELLTGVRELPAKKPSDISDSLWEVILKATENNPDKRFDSADKFIKALDTLSQPSPVKGEEKLSQSSPLVGEDKGEGAERKSPEPIPQNLNIQRRSLPKGKETDPGILVKTLLAQLDEVNKTGDTKSINKVAEELFKALEDRVGKDDRRVAEMLEKLAELNLRNGNYQAAYNYRSRLRSLDSRSFGETSPEVLSDLVHLAEIKLAQGEIIPSREDYKKVLVSGEKIWGKEHPNTAIILNNLAGIYYQEKNYVTAQGLYQRALTINEKHCGKEHESVAINLYNLALTYEAQGNKSAAQPLYQQAQEIGKKVFQPDDPRLKMIREKLKE